MQAAQWAVSHKASNSLLQDKVTHMLSYSQQLLLTLCWSSQSSLVNWLKLTFSIQAESLKFVGLFKGYSLQEVFLRLVEGKNKDWQFVAKELWFHATCMDPFFSFGSGSFVYWAWVSFVNWTMSTQKLKNLFKKITFIIGFILAVLRKIEHGVSSDRRQSSILAEKLIFNTQLIFSH